MGFCSALIVMFMASFGVVLTVEYCTLCAFDSCIESHACLDEDLLNATGCISFWISYNGNLNLSYAGCWEPSFGSCEELIEYEKLQGFDAVCSICYNDNCNVGVKF
ncbi:hypothetical protein D910_12664 [Dendroctonus ponderosae]|uniref:Protein quiver n=1 Tax=Dendroctonus ponderosae TaxID=77166 RepID=U4UYK4_DENPD|nr:hypothetical protein D910_12664 [Dendroctonus ponderosae]